MENCYELKDSTISHETKPQMAFKQPSLSNKLVLLFVFIFTCGSLIHDTE